jgi:hypothetical protein
MQLRVSSNLPTPDAEAGITKTLITK